MKIYKREYSSYENATAPKETFIETYTQPLGSRILYLGFVRLDKIFYAEPIRWLIEHTLEVYSYARHQRHCNNDCVMGKRRKTPEDIWIAAPMCGYMPLLIRSDLKLYNLDRKHNKIISYVRKENP